MPEIPPPSDDTVQLIFKSYEDRNEPRRSNGLGASEIGKFCHRAIWYSFRWAWPFFRHEGRILRLFQTGGFEEPRLVDDLRAIGCEVHEIDPNTKKQWRLQEWGGHFVCKLDAALVNLPAAPKTWHSVEFKTHGDKSFKDLQKNGLEKSKPEHFAQVVTGMGLSGMTRALYLAKNKNTEELYSVRVKHDDSIWLKLKAKAYSIIFSDEAPRRISEDPNNFACRFCDHRTACHQARRFPLQVLPEMNCRTCAHVTPREDGTWFCELHQLPRSKDEQAIGCTRHLFNTSIVPLEAVKAHDDSIEYKAEDGTQVWNHAGGTFDETPI